MAASGEEGGRLAGGLGVDVGDGDAGAFAREEMRDGAADVGAGAEDNRDLALETSHAVAFWRSPCVGISSACSSLRQVLVGCPLRSASISRQKILRKSTMPASDLPNVSCERSTIAPWPIMAT